ncbi:MAG: MFS transporter [Planctomycetes bacterium]|nr:MFS transporter [Planctomycetota bacterium]MCB9885103.1 MFS transporter [Planctomycetota bacterium]
MKPPPAPGTSRVRTAAWVLYDLANTVYAAMVTFLFTPYARQVLDDKLSGVGWANFASMVIAAVLVPICGAIADHTGRAHRYLTIATLVCIAAMCGIGADFGSFWMLLCFGVANLTYNLGLLFYNSLLPAVATSARSGFVSGIGVGVGYLGTILVLVTLVGTHFDSNVKFWLAGATFLAFALPCMLLVKNPRRQTTAPARVVVREAMTSLGRTLRELPGDRQLLLFLVGNFCLVDVLNTAVLYFADFTLDTFRPASQAGTLLLFGKQFAGQDGLDGFLQVMGLGLNLLALVFGCVLGAFTDRRPLGVMRVSAVALLGALVGGSWFAGRDPLGYFASLVMLGAFGLAGIWTAGRKLVLLLAPADRVGQYFGLYGITVKLSVIGSVVYAQVADAWGSQAGMLAQSVQLLIGLGCLCLLRKPERTEEDPQGSARAPLPA